MGDLSESVKPGWGGGVSESVKKGKFMTKIFFQIMLYEALKISEK